MNKIDKNWDLFEYKNKIRTYLTKVDENWDQNGILTICKTICFENSISYVRHKCLHYNLTKNILKAFVVLWRIFLSFANQDDPTSTS